MDELFGFKSMHGTTTGKDLFEEVSKCVNEMGLPWDKLVGLTTDGACLFIYLFKFDLCVYRQ